MEHHIRFDADAMTLYLLDQRALPGREDYLPIRTLDETIRATCDNAGHLKLVFTRPRDNQVKLLLLLPGGLLYLLS